MNHLVFKIKQFFKRETPLMSNDELFIDMGSSSIKVGYKGHYTTFKSSIRPCEEVEVTFQHNAIQVNGQWYIVGESTTKTSYTQFKYQKEHLEVLILFALIQITSNNNIEFDPNLNVNMLLPYGEMNTVEPLRKRVNGQYTVKTNYLPTTDIQLQLNNVIIEGESSSYFLNNKYVKERANTCVINIGYGTTDVLLTNSLGHREKLVSVKIGGQYLLSQISQFTNAPTSTVLSSWLNDGYQFKDEELKHKTRICREFLELLQGELNNTVFRAVNPQRLNICFCGGGALLIGSKLIKESFKGMKVITPTDEDCIYSDLKGMELIVIDDLKNLPKDLRESKIIELKQKGLKHSEIAEVLGIGESTVANYMVKYNKGIV